MKKRNFSFGLLMLCLTPYLYEIFINGRRDLFNLFIGFIITFGSWYLLFLVIFWFYKKWLTKFDLSSLKNLVKLRPGVEILLLSLILLLVVFPYLVSGYQSLITWRKQEKSRNEQRKIEASRVLIYQENQGREAILTKYNISHLEKKYKYTLLNEERSCASNECTFNIAISDKIFSYMFGKLKDRKTGSTQQCKRYKDEYREYCPSEPLGYCINYDAFMPSSRLSQNATSSSASATPSPLDLLINDLKTKGYRGLITGMGKCDRLNYESNFREFEKEETNIERMVSENKDHDMIIRFNNLFYNDYKILKSETEQL